MHENPISGDPTHVPPFIHGFGLQLPIITIKYTYRFFNARRSFDIRFRLNYQDIFTVDFEESARYVSSDQKTYKNQHAH